LNDFLFSDVIPFKDIFFSFWRSANPESFTLIFVLDDVLLVISERPYFLDFDIEQVENTLSSCLELNEIDDSVKSIVDSYFFYKLDLRSLIIDSCFFNYKSLLSNYF
jgi:hypothetical protein